MTRSDDAGEPTQNGYDRPTGTWACGHADGTECLLGPTRLGVCQATGACSPRREGDRWECNRPAIRGGKCQDGPTPEGLCQCETPHCSPRRSVRSNRTVFAFACLALTLGVLMIVLNTNYRGEFLAPGKLTTSHAQILAAPEVKNRCAACHPSGNDSPSEWVAQAIGLPTSSTSIDAVENEELESTETAHVAIRHRDSVSREGLPDGQITQTDLCMRCHEQAIHPMHSRNPHSLATELLAALTQKHRSASDGNDQPESDTKLQFVSTSSSPEADDLACSACHREHHGTEHDLTRLTDAQCQNCHANQFHSFEQGHPEFAAWPYKRRQRIAFDHASHSGKHFKKEAREFNCNDCHQSANGSDVVSVTSYSTCADCHESDIYRSVEEGLTVFQLPTIDSLALDDAGFDIGQWPAKADGEFDGTLPDVMKLLLAADEAALDAFDTLGSDFDFYEADPEDDEQMEAVAKLVWAIKRLLFELAENPAQAWRTRIQNVLNRELDTVGLHHLQTSYSRSHFNACAEAWFTDLREDLRLEFDGQMTLRATNLQAKSIQPSYGSSIRRTPPVQIRRAARLGWQVDLNAYKIEYVPEGHADEFVAALLDLLAMTAMEPAEEIIDDVRATFLTTTSIGTCIGCHSLDQNATHQVINWRSKSKTSTQTFEENSGLTKFSHRQHLMQPSLSDCSHCHKLDYSADFKSAFKSVDNVHANFVSNFNTLKKEQCVGCHNQQTGKDSCTSCHDYHVHPMMTKTIATPRLAESIVPTRHKE